MVLITTVVCFTLYAICSHIETDPGGPMFYVRDMILIIVKWPIKPEYADQWPELSAEFTEATRAEPGCKWFDWSRSLDDPNTYVLVEAFEDDAAEAHVTSNHFKQAQAELPKYLAATPDIINTTIADDDWSKLGEMQVD